MTKEEPKEKKKRSSKTPVAVTIEEKKTLSDSEERRGFLIDKLDRIVNSLRDNK